MIDRPQPYVGSARLPVPAGLGRGFVLASVFVCAACGLVYELELVAVASSLVGDSVTQASVVLSVMVFAMGVGSLLAKRLRCHAAAGFGYVEALLALVGGGSAMALYASFAWLGGARVVLVLTSFTIGALIGAEMPLLMTLIQRIRAQDPGGAVADLFAADYVGALVGGLTFPFLLLPLAGELTSGLLTGVVNALAGGLVVQWLFRHDLRGRARYRLLAANGCVLSLLLVGTAFVGPFEEAARRAVYGDDVRVAVHTAQQELVLTGGATRAEWPAAGELRLFQDGRLALRGRQARAVHRGLVRPAMEGGPRDRVLIVGGGDGLAVREVLRFRGVREVTVVERDPGVVRLARRDPGLRALNRGALDDPRVGVVNADPFDWLRERVRSDAARFDVMISALPAPEGSAGPKLYSQEFYGLAARALADEGRLAVRAGAPGGRARDFWTVDATLRAAGLRPCPYGAGRRFLLARPAKPAPPTCLGERRTRVPPSTLMHPRYAE
ncbi:polyamine aminopropyltransferase [Streptomyces oryzae]|uniref:Polyamine aminopropyltransferase n=1 Tax=Streptomyces oryzae TaxID=1434886 RepID=A0ABS3XLF8_9ACTN|nr:polyamine aminopropyltransferase [Streptomyces oryzae]MBO8196226.1 polyamine aminopropyltransferase [Streptomyces oryzae]